MKRRAFLVASLAILAGCAAPAPGRPVYDSPWYEGVRRDRYRRQYNRRQESPLAQADEATRHVDSMVRRFKRWGR